MDSQQEEPCTRGPRWWLAGGLLGVLLLVTGCRPAPAPPVGAPAGPVSVFVSIPPHQWLVERVGGTRVTVEVLVPPGQNPHSYSPTPQQVARLAQARVLFIVGMPFEKGLVPKIAGGAKELRIVDLNQGIKLRHLEEAEVALLPAADGAADTDHDEPAGTPDPHTWLNPLLVKQQAATVRDALTAADPAGQAGYAANCEAAMADLDRVHARLTAALAPLKGRELFVYHPAYGYFADAYGLRQVAVEIAGKEPSARQLVRMVELAKERRVRVIFVQPQFSPRSAQAVATEIGGAVVPLDELAADYLKNLENMAAAIRAAVQ